jgi:PAS domain S-box-containing protein
MGSVGRGRRAFYTGDLANVGRPVFFPQSEPVAEPPTDLAAQGPSLNDAHERYMGLFDFVPLPLFTLDRVGTIRELNLAAAAMLGRTRQQLLGTLFFSLFASTERALVRRHLARSRKASPESATVNVTLTTAKGPMPVQVMSRLSDRRRGACWTTIVDRTDGQRQEETRRQLNDAAAAAQAASEAKNLFISVLGHELRNPLAAIGAAAEVLRRTDTIEALPQLAEILERSVRAQTRLIEDVLDVTGVMRGKVRLEPAPTDVHEIVLQAVETFGIEIGAKSLMVDLDLRAELHVVKGDPLRLRQVFWNLVRNAIKFTPENGRISLRSWNNGNRIAIEVADTGVGIAPLALERLFQPFEQVVQGRGGGVGLGLGLARGLVELHGGLLTAASEGLGKGARFVVELSTSFGVPTQPTATTPATKVAALGRSTRILLVEDNVDIAEPLARVLSVEGYQVEVAATFRAAMKADFEHIQLVLSDLQLPDGNGLDLVRRIRRQSEVKAIALGGTGGQPTATAKAARSAGFAAFFEKPLDVPDLLNTIAHVLEDSSPRRRRRPFVHGSSIGGRA